MNGCIIPNTPIAVDFWSIRKIPRHIKLFFLSHAHGDHTVGLRSSWCNTIYCSEITARIIQHKFDIKNEFIHPLSVNDSHIITLDEKQQLTMTVSVIDANHCPGAVMFLFDGYFGRVLYTGDFRYVETMFVNEPLNEKRLNIDVLYLDNTYNDENCKFPLQSDAKQEVVRLVKKFSHLRRIIALGDLGKEDLLVEIAKQMKCWIHVDKKRYKFYKILDLPEVFTMEDYDKSVSVVPKWKISCKNIERWNGEEDTIVIYPTALFTGLENSPFQKYDNVHIVNYSNHSSYCELIEFVKRVRPNKIVPIVNYDKDVYGCDCKNRVDISHFDCYLDSMPKSEVIIPDYSKLTHNTVTALGQRNQQRKRNSRKLAIRRSKVKRGVSYDSFHDNNDEKNDDVDKNVTPCKTETPAQITILDKYAQNMLRNPKHEETSKNLNLSFQAHNDNKRCLEFPKVLRKNRLASIFSGILEELSSEVKSKDDLLCVDEIIPFITSKSTSRQYSKFD